MTALPPSNHSRANMTRSTEQEIADSREPQPLIVRLVFPPEIASALMAYAAEHDIAPHVAVKEFVRVHLGLAGAVA